jgi:large subunit ribosomal protein L9
MKVLLTQDVFNLGHAGEVKTVADGYGRNYLLPRGMAILATTGAVKSAERIKAKGIEKRAKERADVESQAQLVSGATIHFHARAGEKGKLFGSITAAQIAAEIGKRLGGEFDKRKVGLREPIREVGTYTVPVRFGTEVSSNVTVIITPEGVITEETAPVSTTTDPELTQAPVAESPTTETPA